MLMKLTLGLHFLHLMADEFFKIYLNLTVKIHKNPKYLCEDIPLMNDIETSKKGSKTGQTNMIKKI